MISVSGKNWEEVKVSKRVIDKVIIDLDLSDRAGWVCGLGHGILKTTPEENVRYFIKTIRETFK